jgi:predicted aldo/keto reductase-like oxidoreductase
VAHQVPIGDVMRCLMYLKSYENINQAQDVFQNIPATARKRLSGIDYSDAERRCPRKLAIGRLMRQAANKLA